MNALVTYWQSLSSREQRFLLVASGFIFIAVLYWGVLAPLQQRAEIAENRLRSEKNLLNWVEGKAAEIESLRAIKGTGQATGRPLQQVVTSSVGRFNLEIIRLNPVKDEIQVWLKPMPFNILLKWIDHLSVQYGVGVIFLELGKTDTQGLVEVKRLQLGQK
ncbi:type II secretion system protein M [Veronia pacifica]|uniref:Type II secretion system protein M n=1 Tax=Veronia pacifica TaxID=1080227 RepID=A0A1C3EJQ3_9GAMM|nr:type II secretion system protein M [Veronia pacifica]ODA33466.1 general secretion pathway protein GspM [Veronia pacifica]